MIELKHLKKAYEQATPLEDVNAVINEGDVIAVIGPSGTGKSTLLRCINRLDEPTSGQVIIDGEDITDKKCDIDKVRQKLGMVFQSFNLFENLTVVENCMTAQQSLHGYSRQDAYDRSMRALKSVGMDTRALQYPCQLSGGQKQRVAIARTLVTDPEIILFDEPTSALDPLSVNEVEKVIAKLAEEGRTMMIVTHSMDFARSVSNRVFYMDKGGIYEDGTPEQIFDNPVKERTREFIKRLACLRFEIDVDNNNLYEEHGKLYAFCSDRKIDIHRTENLCNAYEELCAGYRSIVVGKDRRVLVSLEYSDKEDRLTLSMIPLSLQPGIKHDSREINTSLEFRLLIKYVKAFDIEETDEGAGVRLVYTF